MTTAQKPTSGINLLPQEEFAASTLGRILAWLLSTFRIIVILTEVIVMGVFLSRFWLDAKANDLNETIRRDQAILATTTNFEKEFKDIQKKLDTFSKVTSMATNTSSYVSKISGNLPPDVYLNSFQITEESIQIKGSSVSEPAIAQFVINLKNENDFSNVALIGTNTSQQDKSLIVFNVKIEPNIKGEK